ncbi:Ribonuclease E inhibitor RraA [Geobacillus proteiniphilus]|uniref:Ribonuclease E inhibitor RraA n=1 Tax=Geobacillus proteiniphilus TaxID=860353 RepID=A0A1Q5SQA7_9BACL|nr:Ribonuclease E inhibitor RraA [Geobacillus proteiniphilus]
MVRKEFVPLCTARNAKKEGKGARDVALEFGGVRWEPGAYVYADADGVVVAREDLSAKNG